jgi:hypothetical protein
MSPSNFLYAYLFQIGFLAFNMRRSFVTCERCTVISCQCSTLWTRYFSSDCGKYLHSIPSATCFYAAFTSAT